MKQIPPTGSGEAPTNRGEGPGDGPQPKKEVETPKVPQGESKTLAEEVIVTPLHIENPQAQPSDELEHEPSEVKVENEPQLDMEVEHEEPEPIPLVRHISIDHRSIAEDLFREAAGEELYTDLIHQEQYLLRTLQGLHSDLRAQRTSIEDQKKAIQTATLQLRNKIANHPNTKTMGTETIEAIQTLRDELDYKKRTLEQTLKLQKETEKRASKLVEQLNVAEKKANELIEDMSGISSYLEIAAILKTKLIARQQRHGKLTADEREAFFKKKIKQLELQLPNLRYLNDSTKALIIDFASEMPDIPVNANFVHNKNMIKAYLSHLRPSQIDSLLKVTSELKERKKRSQEWFEASDKVGSFINTATLFLAPADAVPILNVIANSIVGFLSLIQSGLGIMAARDNPALGSHLETRKARVLGAASIFALASGICAALGAGAIIAEAGAGLTAMITAAAGGLFPPISVGLLIISLGLTAYNAFKDYQAASAEAAKNPQSVELNIKKKAKFANYIYNLGIVAVSIALLFVLIFPPSGIAVLTGACVVGTLSAISWGVSANYERKAKALENIRIEAELKEKKGHAKNPIREEIRTVMPKEVMQEAIRVKGILLDIEGERERIMTPGFEAREMGESTRQQIRRELQKLKGPKAKQGKQNILPPMVPPTRERAVSMDLSATMHPTSPSNLDHKESSDSLADRDALSPANMSMPRAGLPTSPQASEEEPILQTPKGGEMPKGRMIMFTERGRVPISEEPFRPIVSRFSFIPQEPSSEPSSEASTPTSLGTPPQELRPKTATPSISPPPYSGSPTPPPGPEVETPPGSRPRTPEESPPSYNRTLTLQFKEQQVSPKKSTEPKTAKSEDESRAHPKSSGPKK